MSTPLFFTITTIGDAQGEVEGTIILADSNPLISSANFARNFGATRLTRCAIGLLLRHLHYRLHLAQQAGGVSFTHQKVSFLPDQLK